MSRPPKRMASAIAQSARTNASGPGPHRKWRGGFGKPGLPSGRLHLRSGFRAGRGNRFAQIIPRKQFRDSRLASARLVQRRRRFHPACQPFAARFGASRTEHLKYGAASKEVQIGGIQMAWIDEVATFIECVPRETKPRNAFGVIVVQALELSQTILIALGLICGVSNHRDCHCHGPYRPSFRYEDLVERCEGEHQADRQDHPRGVISSARVIGPNADFQTPSPIKLQRLRFLHQRRVCDHLDAPCYHPRSGSRDVLDSAL